jgi:hypothetical protein
MHADDANGTFHYRVQLSKISIYYLALKSIDQGLVTRQILSLHVVSEAKFVHSGAANRGVQP